MALNHDELTAAVLADAELGLSELFDVEDVDFTSNAEFDDGGLMPVVGNNFALPGGAVVEGGAGVVAWTAVCVDSVGAFSGPTNRTIRVEGVTMVVEVDDGEWVVRRVVDWNGVAMQLGYLAGRSSRTVP